MNSMLLNPNKLSSIIHKLIIVKRVISDFFFSGSVINVQLWNSFANQLDHYVKTTPLKIPIVMILQFAKIHSPEGCYI